MTNKDPVILRAERLRAILNMPEYANLIGAWIEEARSSALHSMTNAKEPYEFHSAQGAYKAIESLRDQFNRVFAMEKVAVDKLNKILTKKGEPNE